MSRRPDSHYGKRPPAAALRAEPVEAVQPEPLTQYTMDIDELATLLGVSTTILYRDAREDDHIEIFNGQLIPALRRGRRVFVGRAQVVAALERASA